MRCLYSRFERYPNCVTKVLQTLLRYLDRREWLRRRYLPQITGPYRVELGGAGVSPAVARPSCPRTVGRNALRAAVTSVPQGTKTPTPLLSRRTEPRSRAGRHVAGSGRKRH